MQVLITGDSHTGVLERAKNLLIKKNEWPEQIDLTVKPLGGGYIFSTPFFIDRGDHAEICNPEYREQFDRFPPAEMDNTEVVYGLAGPLHTGRVRRSKAWSKFVPSQFAVNETPVSNALLRQVILDDCQYLLKFIDIILRTRKKIFVIEAPKPFRHDSSLNSTRAEVYSYIDSYYREVISQELSLRKVPIIKVSAECYDEKGFMLERYRNRRKSDMHHGNLEFGELMMKNILDFLLNEQKPD